MATVVDSVAAMRDDINSLKERVGYLERALERFVPQPNPTVIQHNAALPRPADETTMAPMGHPHWTGMRRRTPDGGYDDAA